MSSLTEIDNYVFSSDHYTAARDRMPGRNKVFVLHPLPGLVNYEGYSIINTRIQHYAFRSHPFKLCVSNSIQFSSIQFIRQ